MCPAVVVAVVVVVGGGGGGVGFADAAAGVNVVVKHAMLQASVAGRKKARRSAPKESGDR